MRLSLQYKIYSMYTSGDEDFIEFSHRESVDEILMDLSRFIRKNSGHE